MNSDYALIVEQFVSSVAADQQIRSYVHVANTEPFINTLHSLSLDQASYVPYSRIFLRENFFANFTNFAVTRKYYSRKKVGVMLQHLPRSLRLYSKPTIAVIHEIIFSAKRSGYTVYRVSASPSISMSLDPAQNARFFEILVVEIILLQDAYNVICSTCAPSVGVPIVMYRLF